MPEVSGQHAGFDWPKRLPMIRLYDRSPIEGYPWQDAALAAAAGLLLAVVVGYMCVWLKREHRKRMNPHGEAVLRLSRASRLTAAQRRLIELAAERSKVDRLAILVAPSAFDRAMAMANLPAGACRGLRVRLFGVRSRAAAERDSAASFSL